MHFVRFGTRTINLDLVTDSAWNRDHTELCVSFAAMSADERMDITLKGEEAKWVDSYLRSMSIILDLTGVAE